MPKQQLHAVRHSALLAMVLILLGACGVVRLVPGPESQPPRRGEPCLLVLMRANEALAAAGYSAVSPNPGMASYAAAMHQYLECVASDSVS